MTKIEISIDIGETKSKFSVDVITGGDSTKDEMKIAEGLTNLINGVLTVAISASGVKVTKSEHADNGVTHSVLEARE